MKDSGYAVYVKGSVTGHPVAIFAYADCAAHWAQKSYSGRFDIKPFAWQEQPDPAREATKVGPATEAVIEKAQKELRLEEDQAKRRGETADDEDETTIWFTLGQLRAFLAEHGRGVTLPDPPPLEDPPGSRTHTTASS